MTTDDTTAQRITGWVKDLHAMEGHLEEALNGQTQQDARSPEVGMALQYFHDTVRDSTSRIQNHLATRKGADESSLKDSVAEALGSAAGMVDKARGKTLGRAVRDDYVAFNSIYIAYTMLLTSARAVGDDQTATIAEMGVKDYAKLTERVNEVIAIATMDDLQADAEVIVSDPDAATGVREAIDAAWTD